MKKQLLVLALISAAQIITPEWREHKGPFGWALNVTEGAVEAPVDIVSNGAQRSKDNGPYNDKGYNKDGYTKKGRYNKKYDTRINRSPNRD